MERVASEMSNQSLLKTCREIIAAEVVSVLGDEPATLDDSMRAKAVAVFEQIASALRGVK
jgi:archaellum component FlaG (FlaF/FlaG flagellin family)